ncbi:MAG: hypothetical protein GX491_16775 [Chloroflexi bacterium]|nr:hypothetical protein [Chloroflexota bacterium]
MKKWLAELFKGKREENAIEVEAPAAAPADTAVSTADSALIECQNEAQSLRISLRESQATIENLKQEIERLRAGQQRLVEETAAAQVTALFSDLAAPASQIRTQASLLEQGKPVHARDVLAVAARMVRALERSGMQFEGQIGAEEAYDPNRHTPMSAGAAPQPGQPVTVRFSGVRHRDKIIYKAVVEQVCQDD